MRKKILLVCLGVFCACFENIEAQTNAESTEVVVSTTLTPRMLFQKDNSEEMTEIPNAFSYDKLGFFCKMEYQIERKVPLMIRLGEVKSTERMEGKKTLPR